MKIASNRYSQLNESDLVLWPTRASSNKDRVYGMRYKYDETKAKNSRHFQTNDGAEEKKNYEAPNTSFLPYAQKILVVIFNGFFFSQSYDEQCDAKTNGSRSYI